jgi:HK97 gp10 family phage protein
LSVRAGRGSASKAGMMFDVSVLGDKELAKTIRRLEFKVARRVMAGALRAGAKVIKARAKANAPRDSGKLAKTLRVRKLKVRKGQNARKSAAVGVMTGTRAKLGLPPKGRFYYPAIIELGAAGYRTPRPFLKPALEASRGTALEAIRKEAWKRLAKEAAKAKAKGRA